MNTATETNSIYIREAHGAKVEIDTERLVARGFIGKAKKAAFSYRFHSAEKMHGYVEDFFAAQELRCKYKETKKLLNKAKKDEFVAQLNVGTIVYTSCGYDQTNVDFYEVVEVKGSKVTLRGIDKEITEDGNISGQAIAVPGAYNGDEKSYIVRNNYIKISSYKYAWIWDGRSKFVSWYG